MIFEDIKDGAGKILGDGSSLPKLRMTRSIGKDLKLIIVWCDEECTPFNKIPSTEDVDDADQLAMALTSTLDVCNKFRSSLKPAFKQIATRINEITDEMNNIDVSEQITASENKINDKLKEYISRYELIREDVIDMFAKYDDEHKVLIFEFVDNIID